MDQIFFAERGFDRADDIRTDPVRLASLYRDPRARLLHLNGILPQLDREGALSWLSIADAPMGRDLIFLGRDEEGIPHFTAALPYGDCPPRDNPRALWGVLHRLGAADAANYARARSLLLWHEGQKYCARCGDLTHMSKGGWSRLCGVGVSVLDKKGDSTDSTDIAGGCGGEIFPPVNPVTIMIVENAGRILLGRQYGFPSGSFSALAGFVEPGEDMEGAVKREIMEEAGVRAYDINYAASQPWPFPASLMIGCFARTDDEDIILDKKELEDARWFSHDQIGAALSGADNAEFTVPPPFAIAHYLIRHWYDNWHPCDDKE